MWWGCKFFKKNLNKHWSAWSMFLLPNPDLFFFLRDAWWVQGLQNRPVRSNRFPPVAVYRTGLTGYRLKPAKFKIACVTDSERYTNRFDRLSVGLTGNRSVWVVTDQIHFFFFFWFKFKCPQSILNECLYNMF